MEIGKTHHPITGRYLSLEFVDPGTRVHEIADWLKRLAELMKGGRDDYCWFDSKVVEIDWINFTVFSVTMNADIAQGLYEADRDFFRAIYRDESLREPRPRAPKEKGAAAETNAAERCAIAIKKSKRMAQANYDQTQNLRDGFYALKKEIVDVMHFQPKNKALTSLVNRLERQVELLNEMELGSFTLELNDAMEAAWRELP